MVIPPAIRVIKHSAFNHCSGLMTAILNNGLEEIEAYAFARCMSHVHIRFPLHSIVARGWRLWLSMMGWRRLGHRHLLDAHPLYALWSSLLSQQFTRRHSMSAQIINMWGFVIKSKSLCPRSWCGIGGITWSTGSAWVGMSFSSYATYWNVRALYYQGCVSLIFMSC